MLLPGKNMMLLLRVVSLFNLLFIYSKIILNQESTSSLPWGGGYCPLLIGIKYEGKNKKRENMNKEKVRVGGQNECKMGKFKVL